MQISIDAVTTDPIGQILYKKLLNSLFRSLQEVLKMNGLKVFL